MKTSDFDYHLPPEYIAQTPVEPRDTSRLLVLDRDSKTIEHHHFYQLVDYLNSQDLLVLNETRVIPARLSGRKVSTGGRVEFLLLHPVDSLTWEVLVGGKGLRDGKQVQFEDGPIAEIVRVLDGPRRLARFDEPIEPYLDAIGQAPLPPYIHKPLADPERYQTVYARSPGSAAAPTAGLHFTPSLIERLRSQGVRFAKVTLHVGLDTFAPVTEKSPLDHEIHTEWCQVTPEAAEAINRTLKVGGRIIAVGTTSVRTLETAACADTNGTFVAPFAGPTDLFILPGFKFQIVDALITNFHLPRSTLLMLVSAFTGRESIMAAYKEAIETGYRFYSFGDAMFIR